MKKATVGGWPHLPKHKKEYAYHIKVDWDKQQSEEEELHKEQGHMTASEFNEKDVWL